MYRLSWTIITKFPSISAFTPRRPKHTREPTFTLNSPHYNSTMACWACIDQGSVGLVERCGKFDRVVDPGCHVVVPCLGALPPLLLLLWLGSRLPSGSSSSALKELSHALCCRWAVIREPTA